MSKNQKLAITLKSSVQTSSSLPIIEYDQEKRKDEFFRNRIELKQQKNEFDQKQCQRNILMENDFSYIDEDGGDEATINDKQNNKYNRSNSINEINFQMSPPSTPVKLKIVTIKYDSPNNSNNNNNNNNNSNKNVNFKIKSNERLSEINDNYNMKEIKSESNVRNEIEKFNKIHSKATEIDDNKKFSKKSTDSDKLSPNFFRFSSSINYKNDNNNNNYNNNSNSKNNNVNITNNNIKNNQNSSNNNSHNNNNNNFDSDSQKYVINKNNNNNNNKNDYNNKNNNYNTNKITINSPRMNINKISRSNENNSIGSVANEANALREQTLNTSNKMGIAKNIVKNQLKINRNDSCETNDTKLNKKNRLSEDFKTLGAIPKDSKNNFNKIKKDTSIVDSLSTNQISQSCQQKNTKDDKLCDQVNSSQTSNALKKEKYITQDIKDQFNLKSQIFSDISDLEEDPYIELQEYLEKVKREINDVFEEYQSKSHQYVEQNFEDQTNTDECEIKNTKLLAQKLKKVSRNNCDGEINALELLREKSKLHLKSKEVKDVNVWANKIIRELDTLVATNEDESNKLKQQQRLCKCFLKPEKRSTIPLQSFNLLEATNRERTQSSDFTKLQKKIEILEPLISTTPSSPSNSVAINYNNKNNANNIAKNEAVLRIEEGTESEVPSNKTTSTCRSNNKTSPILMKLNKKERYSPNNSGSCSSSGYSTSSTKKGSCSTIWTSDESILRSNNTVGIDDDIKSTTSSSVCDDASGGALSSGKSGNSLDSSEIENEQTNESGNSSTIQQTLSPAATQRSIGSAAKLKFLTDNSITSKSINLDDPDLLDALSFYDGVNNNNNDFNDIDQNSICQNSDQNSDCFDGISNSKNNSPLYCKNNKTNIHIKSKEDEVILRKKPEQNKLNEKNRNAVTGTPTLKNTRNLKARSHIIESKKFSVSNKDIMVKHSGSKDSILDCGGSKLAKENFPESCSSTINIRELQAESSASLHSGNENLSDMIELTTKSNSAPLLMKDSKSKIDEYGFDDDENTLRYSRSQSDRHLAEIEAIEACKWLRAAGFPQYAQMYEDLQFPIDLNNVAKDHPILENDPLQSLYRRLCILNRCATLRLDNASHHKPQQNQKDDSDDENFALSDQWTFQPQIRRWSRIGEIGLELPIKQGQNDKNVESSSKESSPERFGDDDDDEFVSRNYSTLPQNSSDSSKTDSDSLSRLKRTGSERLKDGAKALLRRVESIKTRRKKRQNRDGFVMSGGTGNRQRGPQVLELPCLAQGKLTVPSLTDKTTGINITYSTPPSPSAVSPIHFYPRTSSIIGNDLKVPNVDSSNIFLHQNRLSPKHIPITPRTCHSTRTSPLHFFSSHMPHLREGISDDSAAYMSDSQDSNADSDRLTEMKKLSNRPRRFLQKCKVDDVGAHSDSECHATACRKFIVKELNTTTEHTTAKSKKLTRGGSLNLGKESKKYRDSFQNRSFRSRGSLKKNSKDSDETRAKKPVVRWHSFQNHEKPVFFKKCISPSSEESKLEGTPFAAMSCGQLEMVRKLALVTLTGYMERYCPSHRTGWNWELPKFIKKIKAPDYKDKKLFGVPLVLILQRTGKSLPIGISTALRWLRLNALDQVGIFRKSGVKSRIVKLKDCIESVQSFEDCMDIFDNQQAFDVADVLKQYFRELPDSLLTAKMSETFVAIFQHLPQDLRIDAIQAAVLLLPDENRDVLYSLLAFLNDVAKKSQVNQMTASNLAVCLAPSLFNSNIATGNPIAVSPRRKKLGQPNMKELAETKASHECLTLMIQEYKKIFSASQEKVLKCNFGYMEESKPVPLEQLGEGMQYYNWRGYLYECTKATIKEGREKSRGWVAINSLDPNIEIAYKKVGDGHLLRLWRCLTEVEGPPTDVLNFILNERNNWDNNLLECHEVKKLDEKTQIYYYSLDGPYPNDFCVLRSWQINSLPKQACVIVETSIDHRDAPQTADTIRGVVLASRYLIEPCGSGRSRVMHLSRVDLKGKRPEWYNKNYGHICSQYLANVRSVFKHVADGPESKV